MVAVVVRSTTRPRPCARCCAQGATTIAAVATLRLFAVARELAGTSRADIDGSTVDAVLSVASARYGPAFEAVLSSCKVWVNGEEAAPDTIVGAGDEVAVLPPVSGGST